MADVKPAIDMSRDLGPSSRPKKVKRISKACDFCHNRSIRCQASTEDSTRCQSCLEYDQACTYDRPTKKRGAKSSKSKEFDQLSPTTPPGSGTSSIPAPAGPTWQPQHVTNQATVVDLVEIYFEVIYPIYPLFHRPTLTYMVSRGDYNNDRAFYSTVMAVCALSSSRVRDGALLSTRWESRNFTNPSSALFFAAAEEALPKNYTASEDLNYLRAYAFLSIAALQNNQITKMNYFMGMFDVLVKCNGLHDEKNWSNTMTLIEREERRRLFWAMYMFEVYVAAVWGNLVCCREAQSNVHYPAEVDDDFLTQTNDEVNSRPRQSSSSEMSLAYTLNSWGGASGPMSFLQGWNFAIDIYRVLEHAIDGFRHRAPDTDHTKFVAEVWKIQLPLQSNVLDAMMHKYSALPARFRQTLPITHDPVQDRFSFQAANIAATIQLVRMTLVTSAQATAEERCQVLIELVHTFANVPVQYLRAMSTPILHHLAGVGTILESVFEAPVSEATYQQVRNVIIALADLLASLETGMGSTAGASERLRSQVHRMDGYMQTQLVRMRSHSSQQQQQPHSQQREQNHYGQRQHSNQANMLPPIPHASSSQASFPQVQSQYQQHNTDPTSQYHFPPEVFDDWNFAFDFTQTQR